MHYIKLLIWWYFPDQEVAPWFAEKICIAWNCLLGGTLLIRRFPLDWETTHILYKTPDQWLLSWRHSCLFEVLKDLKNSIIPVISQRYLVSRRLHCRIFLYNFFIIVLIPAWRIVNINNKISYFSLHWFKKLTLSEFHRLLVCWQHWKIRSP